MNQYMARISDAFEQLKFLGIDFSTGLGRLKIRALHYWMSRSFVGVALYRCERFAFLLFGRGWKIGRVLISPLLNIAYAYSNTDINYGAEIGPGIKILHPSLGVVINGRVIIGSQLTLTGGNCVGGKKRFERGEYVIGDNCYLGANSSVMGPLILGDNVIIGAGGVVTKSFQGSCVLAGVPARDLNLSGI
ncbi:hypothetical protein OAF99_01680 [Akkermansiaceae bacterium]|nr:hypothetical protein [Akkermansiaceae bacterium]